MKLMFTIRYAWLCLCLPLSICLGSCATISGADSSSYIKPVKGWVVKAAFHPGYNPAFIEAYYLDSDDSVLLGEKVAFHPNINGTIIIDFYCPTIAQCTEVVDCLTNSGLVEILSINKRY